MGNKIRTAIYPGTFDPLTVGHLDIIQRARSLCDRLIVGVANNQAKNVIFDLEERLEIAKEEVVSLPAHTTPVEVMSFKGLLVHFVQKVQADFVVRGLRAVSDFEYEFQMAGLNAQLTPCAETVFLFASDRCQFISSSFIKEIILLGGDVSPFVSEGLLLRLKKKLQSS